MEQETTKDFFVSYSSADQQWAEWIAWQLEAAGFTTIVQAWDSYAGGNFVLGMNKASTQATRTIAVLSPDYFTSEFTPSEWAAAFRRDPKGEHGTLIPVRVRFCDVEGLLGQIVYIDLVGQDEATAKRILLEHVSRQRRKPVRAPTFPSVSAPSFPGSFPPFWNIPYRRNPFFTGRENILTQLNNVLKTGQATAITQPQAITGLGGIGKTQIAIEYAYQHSQDYQAVLWTLADTHEALVSGYIAIATLLDLPGKDVQDQQITIEAVNMWLRTHSSWLFILDNADDLAVVQEFLPSAFSGHVLLTTRAQAMGRLASRIEVDTMSQDVGAVFLLRRASLIASDGLLGDASTADQTLACEISKELGGLPLALDQAGAYIEETRCGLSDYQQRYRMRRDLLLKRRGGLAVDHPEPVATTWSLSFEKAEQKCPEAADLLRLCAFLSPDAIPEEIITDGAVHLGPLLESLASDPFLLDSAISALLAYSLMRRDPSERMLSVHRLVQAVLKDAINEAEQQSWAERVVRVVNATFPLVEHATWMRCERLLPHVLAVARLIEQRKIMLLEGSSLLNNAGHYLTERARYTEAEPLLKRALTMNEQLLGPEHPETASSLNHLAELYVIQGRYAEAELHHQRALVIKEKVLGPMHVDIAKNLNNLARLYTMQGRYKEAYPLCQRALLICEQVLGTEHPNTATSLNHLAEVYQNQGEYEKAKPLYQRALMICEKVLGPDHPDTAANLNHLAGLYLSQGKHDEAEPLYQRALRIREKSFGPEHPYTATSLNDLAKIYQAQERYEEADLYYQRALAIYEKVLGPEHPYTATSLSNLAEIYQAQERYEEADLYYQRALTIYEKVLEPEHPKIAISLHGLARLYRTQKKYEKADLFHQRALAIYEKTLGPEHHFTAISLHGLALLYCAQERYKEADILYQRAIAIYKKVLGPEHPSTVRALEEHTYLLQKINRED